VIGGNPIIPNWIGTNLVKILEEKYNLPAVLENDVNCVALGEKWIGAGKDLSNFICLTIGTGIGGGIILNNQLFRGENFVAGEFGHTLIKKGEFEQFASTTALIRLVKERTGKIRLFRPAYARLQLYKVQGKTQGTGNRNRRT